MSESERCPKCGAPATYDDPMDVTRYACHSSSFSPRPANSFPGSFHQSHACEVACLRRQLSAANERAAKAERDLAAKCDELYGERKWAADVVADRDRLTAELAQARVERDRLREFMHRVCDSQRQRKAPMPTGGGNPIYYFDTNAIQDAIAWLNNANEMAAMGLAAGQKVQP